MLASRRERLPSDPARDHRGGHHSTAPMSLQPSAGCQLCHPWAPGSPGPSHGTFLHGHVASPSPAKPPSSSQPSNAGASAGPPEPVPKPEGTAHSWSETTYAQLAPNSTPRLPFPTEPVPGRPRPLHPCREGWGTHMQSVHTESWSLLPQSPHPLTGLEHQGPEQGTGRLPPRLSLGRKGVSRAAARPLPGGRAWARRGPGGSV